MDAVWCVPGTHSHHKFEDCVTEALWGVSLDSGHDAETGNVDHDVWVAWFEWFGPGDPPHAVDAGWIGIPTGSYLLLANDRGYVWSRHFDTSREAAAEFARLQDTYFEWEERNHE